MIYVRKVPSHRGFTLVELLITITILAILVSLAVPSMQKMILAQTVRVGASELQTALTFARSEAIKRAACVDVVPCAAPSQDWRNGWIVQYRSCAAAAATTCVAGPTVLRTQNALSPQLSSMPGGTITYGSDGRVTATPGTIGFTTSNTSVQARCIKIDLSGRPNIGNYVYGGGSNVCS